MGRKIIIVVLSAVIIIGAAMLRGVMADSKKPPAKKKGITVSTVFAVPVENQTLPVEIVSTGKLTAQDRIDLFAEVQGVMLSQGKPFKAGQSYSKGDRLVAIESDIFRAGLKSQKSSLQNLITAALADLKLDYPDSFDAWDKYVREFDIDAGVKDLPEARSDKERMFITGRNIYSTYYNVKNQELTLERYNLHAPFNGILTESLVNPGTLIRPGQKLGTFINPSVYEMETPVNSSLVKFLAVGQQVQVNSSDGTSAQWMGEIVRINSSVNSGTQTVNIYIKLVGDGLDEGMFLEALITANDVEEAFSLNRNVLFDDDQVFVVEDSLLVQKTIEPVHFGERTVMVRGLSNGEQVLTKMPPRAYPGMKVAIYQEN
jgi:membrane fusion protein (multidrug efflux system)